MTGSGRRPGVLRGKAHAFAALRAGNARKARNASTSANPYPFSLDLLSRLSRRRLCLCVGATTPWRGLADLSAFGGVEHPVCRYHMTVREVSIAAPGIFQQPASGKETRSQV